MQQRHINRGNNTGKVEKDEPMPMVTSRPTNSMVKAAMPLLLPNKAMLRSTKGWMSPVAFMTAAKPCRRNHNKADHRPSLMPSPNTSLAAERFITPSIINTAKPNIAPNTNEFSYISWMAKHTAIATAATKLR